MKTMLILFAMVTLAFTNKPEDLTTIKATFDGAEEEIYYFIDEDDNVYSFDSINENASEKYNLTEKQYIGKTFNVTYKVETKTNELEEEYESYIIVKLELLK